MNKEDIIRMAHEAGFSLAMFQLSLGCESVGTDEELERFAQLVVAAEREALIEIMYNLDLCGREGVAVEAIRARGQQ